MNEAAQEIFPAVHRFFGVAFAPLRLLLCLLRMAGRDDDFNNEEAVWNAGGRCRHTIVKSNEQW